MTGQGRTSEGTRLGRVLSWEQAGSAQPSWGPLTGLRRGQVGAQEDSVAQGLAGSSARPVDGRAQGKVHTQRPSPHSPPQSPTETRARSPVVGTACWTVGLEPPGTALNAQHGWCSEREAGRFCGAVLWGAERGPRDGCTRGGPEYGHGGRRASGRLLHSSCKVADPRGRSETPRLGGKACGCLGARLPSSGPRRSQ